MRWSYWTSGEPFPHSLGCPKYQVSFPHLLGSSKHQVSFPHSLGSPKHKESFSFTFWEPPHIQVSLSPNSLGSPKHQVSLFPNPLAPPTFGSDKAFAHETDFATWIFIFLCFTFKPSSFHCANSHCWKTNKQAQNLSISPFPRPLFPHMALCTRRSCCSVRGSCGVHDWIAGEVW